MADVWAFLLKVIRRLSPSSTGEPFFRPLLRTGLAFLVVGIPVHSFGIKTSKLKRSLNLNCEILFVEGPRLPVFDPFHLVGIALKPGISEKEMSRTLIELMKIGFRPEGDIETNHDLIGTLDVDQLKAASQLPDVVSVSRSSVRARDTYVGGLYEMEPPQKYDGWLSEALLWDQLNPEPVTGFPTRALRDIQKVAHAKGITTVLSIHRPNSEAQIKDLETLHGTKIIFAEDLPDNVGIVRLPGVVLHIAPLEKALHVRGDLNPLMGHDNLLGRFNKVTEIEWIQSVDPAFVAPSVRASAVLKMEKGTNLEFARKNLKAMVARHLKCASDFSNQDILDLGNTIQKFFDLAELKFPQGAFIKWKSDFGTREANQIVTTSLNPYAMAIRYFKTLALVKEAIPGALALEDEKVDFAISVQGAYSSFVQALLFSPEDLLVQQKLDLAQTPHDTLVEFRVDVFDGIVVNSRFRYGYDVYTREAQQAKRFIESFFKKLPVAESYYSAGFDVAMLTDGTYRIIETNPGTRSAFISATTFPITANQAIAKILGRDTPLLQFLEKTFQSGLEAQIQLLKSAPKQHAKKAKLADITTYEFLEWFRDRYIQDWKDHDLKTGLQVAQKFKALLVSVDALDTYWGQQYLLGIQDYVKRTAK